MAENTPLPLHNPNAPPLKRGTKSIPNTYGVATNKMDEAGSCSTVDKPMAMCTAQTSSVVGDNTNNGNNIFRTAITT